MKKAIATLSIILILLNMFIPYSMASSQEVINGYMENGESSLPVGDSNGTENKNLSIDASGNNQSSLITAFLELLIIPPMILNWVMSLVATNNQSTYNIQDMLLDKYYLFNIDFFSTDDSKYSENDPNKDIMNNLKENVSIWYFSLRNISIIGSALIIIYVAIRLALELAKGGGPKAVAKYKQMIISWMIGFILLCILPYLVRALFYISDFFTNFIYNMIGDGTQNSSMEINVISNSWNNFIVAKGSAKIAYVVLYYAIVFYEFKFFFMYLKRVFEIFFLMIISPLVCMLYPIDKIGDGRSQSFNTWFNLLINQILLRPIHLLVYAIFIATASELAKEQPIIAVLFFMMLSNGEKIIKKIIGIAGPNLADEKGIDAAGKIKKIGGAILSK